MNTRTSGSVQFRHLIDGVLGWIQRDCGGCTSNHRPTPVSDRPLKKPKQNKEAQLKRLRSCVSSTPVPGRPPRPPLIPLQTREPAVS